MPCFERSPLAAANKAYSPRIGVLRGDYVQIEPQRYRIEHYVPITAAQQPQPRDNQAADGPKAKARLNSVGTGMRRFEGCPCRVLHVNLTVEVANQARKLYHNRESIQNV